MLRIIVLLFFLFPVQNDTNSDGINEVASRYHIRTRVERFFDRSVV